MQSSHNFLKGAAETVSQCIKNKQMGFTSSYVICPFPECNWSTEKVSMIGFGLASVGVGAGHK